MLIALRFNVMSRFAKRKCVRFFWGTFAFILVFNQAGAITASPESGNGLKYNSDGHYWTVYLVATLLKLPNARELAFYAERPDHIFDEDGNKKRATNTWLLPYRQGKVHALTGKSPEFERERSRQMILNAGDMKRKGWGLHRLGDSYAHAKPDDKKMYPPVVGHAFTPEGGHAPDMIRNYPEKYLRYVEDLVRVLGGEDARVDMTTFRYIADKKLETEDNIEILKAEIMIQNRRPVFRIREAQSASLAEYLTLRSSDARFGFSIKPAEGGNGKRKKSRQAEVWLVYDEN